MIIWVSSLICCNNWHSNPVSCPVLQAERKAYFRDVWDLFGEGRNVVIPGWRSRPCFPPDPPPPYPWPYVFLCERSRLLFTAETPRRSGDPRGCAHRRPRVAFHPPDTHATGASSPALFTPGSSLGMKGQPRNTLKGQLLGRVLPPTVAEVV